MPGEFLQAIPRPPRCNEENGQIRKEFIIVQPSSSNNKENSNNIVGQVRIETDGDDHDKTLDNSNIMKDSKKKNLCIETGSVVEAQNQEDDEPDSK